MQGSVPSPDAGDAYGLGTAPPYSIYIWSGTEWVDNGNLQGPQGPKGDKGDTGEAGPAGADGAAAGFGTPTATAAQLASTAAPTVTVTASGDDTAKVFSFSFGIPKGEKGDTGETGATGPQGAAGTSVTGAKLVGNHLVIVTNG